MQTKDDTFNCSMTTHHWLSLVAGDAEAVRLRLSDDHARDGHVVLRLGGAAAACVHVAL